MRQGMNYAQLRFESLEKSEQGVLLSFLENLTEGDVRRICVDQMMDREERKELLHAWNRLVYEDWE